MAATGSGGGAAGTTVGQAAVERVGPDAEGPRNGPGLLPNLKAEEIAAIRGKAKMSGYDNVVQNPCFNPMGSQPMEREMGRVQRAGGGFDRAGGADRVMVNWGPNGRTGSGLVEGIRTGAGWTEFGWTVDGWTEEGRPGAGWTTNGQIGVGGPKANPTGSG
ncbi:unnamed protein product [Linum trigynum]|uniref:Uncharacterized protein n=1 Tax=Linum trigynum TaxID=586398 RepID=A0AAV2FD03_9ROSI